MNKAVRFQYLLLFLLLGCFFSSCKKDKKSTDGWDDTMTSGFINIAVDENFRSLMDAMIASFEAHTPGAYVTPIYTTEENAIRLLMDDSVRFAIVTRDLTERERYEVEQKKRKVRKQLKAFDGVAVVVNTLNPDSIFSVETLKRMLTGEITEWSQLNPNTTVGAVRVVFDNPESSSLRFALDSLVQGASMDKATWYALNNSREVLERVSEMPNTIAFIGINALDEAALSNGKLRIARISNEPVAALANSYLPYQGDIHQENYPLWRSVYSLLSDPKSGLSTGFNTFMNLQIGQLVFLRSGLLPVKESHVKDIRVVVE